VKFPRIQPVLDPLIAARVNPLWAVAPQYQSELRQLQRRLAAARLGVGWPRATDRPLRFEDLQ
jgi:hypothetical protein